MTVNHAFEVGNGFPYDPSKAHCFDMIALDLAEKKYPNKNIVVVNKHGYSVCGTRVLGAVETIKVYLSV
jgi:hypothetical protein